MTKAVRPQAAGHVPLCSVRLASRLGLDRTTNHEILSVLARASALRTVLRRERADGARIALRGSASAHVYRGGAARKLSVRDARELAGAKPSQFPRNHETHRSLEVTP